MAGGGRRETVADLLGRLPGPNGERSAVAFERGTLTVKLYAPRDNDLQKPHDRDEVYVVMHGSGEFVCGDDRFDFGPGDLLFAPAGAVHRFENFTGDLTLWVVFYGPRGGELPDG